MRVLLVAPSTSYRLGAFLEAAQRLGLDVVVATDEAVALEGSARPVDLTSAPTGLGAVPYDAVVATDAAASVFATTMALTLHLPRTNPLDAVTASLDKVRQRWCFAGAGVPQPAFRILDADEDAADVAARVGFPVVVKPAAATASQGVIRADDAPAARAAAVVARVVAGRGQQILVERFVAGPEVAVEALLDDGELHVLAVFDKPDAPAGPYFPETVLVAPSVLPAATVTDIERVTAAAAAALGLRQGPLHVELRLDDAGHPLVLELAARSIGGRCARALSFSGGHGLEELVLAQALGLAFDPTPEPGAVGVLMVPIPLSGVVRGVEGVADTAALPAVTAVQLEVTPGDVVTALPEGSGYAGFVFAAAPRPEAVTWTLRRAARSLRVTVSPA